MDDLIFSTLAVPGAPGADVLLLVESIRAFGGGLADRPVLVGVPSAAVTLSDTTRAGLDRLAASVMPIDIGPDLMRFPFAAKVVAAAALEQAAVTMTERLCFLDRDTIVIQEPTEFLLPAECALGYRPVHHRLLGPAWGEPLDSFWSLVHRICEVPDERDFQMVTHCGEAIHPYFNAGALVVRPGRGLLTEWRRRFLDTYREPELEAYYDRDQLYAVFIHQAILTGVVMSQLKREQMVEFSPRVNYPLHLHAEVPVDARPELIDDLVTVRHENIFDDRAWRELPMSPRLVQWLEAQPRVGSAAAGEDGQ